MTTSYDYDAPISEAGDINDKYLAIRQTISKVNNYLKIIFSIISIIRLLIMIKYLPLPPGPLPSNSTKKAYGRIQMQYVMKY